MQRAVPDAAMTVSHARAGVVYPLRGPLNKDAGRRLARFGPLTGWTIDLAAKNPLVGMAHATSAASPVCTLSNYKHAAVAGPRCEAIGILTSCESSWLSWPTWGCDATGDSKDAGSRVPACQAGRGVQGHLQPHAGAVRDCLPGVHALSSRSITGPAMPRRAPHSWPLIASWCTPALSPSFVGRRQD